MQLKTVIACFEKLNVHIKTGEKYREKKKEKNRKNRKKKKKRRRKKKGRKKKKKVRKKEREKCTSQTCLNKKIKIQNMTVQKKDKNTLPSCSFSRVES